MIVPDKFSDRKSRLSNTAIALILLFPICNLTAQDSIQSKSVYVGLSVSSGWSKTYFTAAQRPYFYGTPKDIIPIRIGFDFKFKFTEHLSVSTGIFVDRTGTKVESTFLPMPVYNNQPTITSAISKNANFFCEIPLRLDIRFSEKRVSPFITAGGYGGIFYEGISSAEIKFSDGSYRTSSNAYHFDPKAGLTNQLYSNFQIGFGLDAVTRDFKFQAYPLYEFGFLRGYGKPIYRNRIAVALAVAYGF